MTGVKDLGIIVTKDFRSTEQCQVAATKQDEYFPNCGPQSPAGGRSVRSTLQGNDASTTGILRTSLDPIVTTKTRLSWSEGKE
ncbi:unnamed protein product [Echinostoma caproni]|uniref:Uncharacterized protein n=1 Tax=Echinostoma caproni TaxID=27848 RepID=A0A183AZ66_9TREM|nr:unnamed protein product [Echinostoma caproni]